MDSLHIFPNAKLVKDNTSYLTISFSLFAVSSINVMAGLTGHPGGEDARSGRA
jgi:hypothetical protein